MTTHVYVCSQRFGGDDPLWILGLGGDGYTNMCVHVTPDTPPAVATATCDFLVRLLATCEQRDLYIEGCSDGVPSPLSGAALSLFFQESPSCLREVLLWNLALDADQCLALATMSRFDVQLRIDECSLADDAVELAFVECLISDRGPVKLDQCILDNQILMSALTGDSRVTKLEPDSQVVAVAGSKRKR
jgi:hypothetical protein